MSSTSYLVIERQVYDFLNALRSDDVATAEATYAKTDGLVNADIDDVAFPRSAVRRNIVTAESQIIIGICQTEGHSRRRDFMSLATVLHADQVPSSMGPIGAVYDNATGAVFQQRDVADINRMRANPVVVGGVTPTFRYFALDGSRIFLTTPSAQLEYVNYNAFAGSPANVEAKFTPQVGGVLTPTNYTLVADEFAPALAYLATAICAGKAAGFTEAGAYYGQLYAQAMREQGVTVTPRDFAAEPRGGQS